MNTLAAIIIVWGGLNVESALHMLQYWFVWFQNNARKEQINIEIG